MWQASNRQVVRDMLDEVVMVTIKKQLVLFAVWGKKELLAATILHQELTIFLIIFIFNTLYAFKRDLMMHDVRCRSVFP